MQYQLQLHRKLLVKLQQSLSVLRLLLFNTVVFEITSLIVPGALRWVVMKKPVDLPPGA